MATNLKARVKANPSRIQQNIQNSQAIVAQEIVDNSLLHIAESEELAMTTLPEGNFSVPLNFWLENRQALATKNKLTAVQLGSDQNPKDLAEHLSDIQIVVLPFVAYVDGRGYSHSLKLRKHYNYQGEIRAIGDVKFDQLGFLVRVGVDAFELAETEDLQTALRAFNEFSDVYQPSSDNARLIFSRRRAVH